MTEPDGGELPPEEGESQLDAALGRFKPREPDADTSPVSDNGRAGLRWNPVTDTGTATVDDDPVESRPRSSFQFDLGSALARLGGATEPRDDRSADEPDSGASADPLPVRGRERGAGSDDPVVHDPADPLPVRERREAVEQPADPLPVRARPSTPEPAPEPLPTRTPPTDVPDDPHRSVVDRLPTRTPRTGPSAPPPVAPSVDEPGEAPAARTTSPSRSVFDDANPSPVLPRGATPRTDATRTPAESPAPPAGAAPFLPTLPASMPSAPPAVTAPIASAPSTPEINALRSAQLRASRNDRQGKLLTRSLLGLLLVGGMVAAALLFGRSYLFPTEWTAELTPLVDEIQSARGVEFDEAATLVERPASEYAPLVTAHVLGPDWSARLPEWRALGLAGGDGAIDDVQERIASLYPAFHDAETGEIVASIERSAAGREAALRLALEDVLVTQLGADGTATPMPLGLTGLDPIDAVARRAIDAAAADLLANAPEAVADLSGVPIPVAYQLRAIDSIGTALLDGDDTARPGDPMPAAAARLDDEAAGGPGGLLQPGDEQVLAQVALGTDDWALIWGARLPAGIVDGMVESLRTDSYTVVDRAGSTCFVAAFQTGTETAAAALIADLGTWVASAPSGARATVASLGPDRVQLEACDPGADAAQVPAVSAVDVVITRQLGRLAAG